MRVDSFLRLGKLFFIFQTGTSLALISSHIFRLAIAWWCLKETQSAVAFSSLIALSAAAEIYLKPFLASLGDKFDRVKFILFCQISLWIIMCFFCVLISVEYFDVLLVSAGLVLMSIIISAREPTSMGLIPDLVPEGDVSNAISSRSGINSIITLLAPALAALIISTSSIHAAMYVATVLLGGACIGFVVLSITGDERYKSHNEIGTWFQETKGAFRAIYRVKSEFYIALISAVINFTMFPFFSVTVPYWISSELKLPAVYFGAFEFSLGLGLILGSLHFNTFIRERVGRLYNVVLGFILLGCSVTAVVAVNNIYISIILAFFCGLAFILINVNLSTLRSTATPNHYRTRMSAMAGFVSSLANPLGVVITGWFISWMGVVPFTLISGIIVILIAPVILRSSHLKKALSLDERAMKGYYEKTYPEAFIK